MAMTSNGRIYREKEGNMNNDQGELTIPLQVGTELRIKNNGEISLDNPEVELAKHTGAADAVLSYRSIQTVENTSYVYLIRLLIAASCEYIAEGISVSNGRIVAKSSLNLTPIPTVQTNVNSGCDPHRVRPRREHPATVNPNPSASYPIPMSRHPHVSWTGRGNHGSCNDSNGRRWRQSTDRDSEVDMRAEDEAGRQQKRGDDKRSDTFHRHLCSRSARHVPITCCYCCYQNICGWVNADVLNIEVILYSLLSQLGE
jgi:hypothetical protein